MSTKACIALQNEPLTWMLTHHGDGYALGWRGPREFISLAYNLFANYYQPKNGQTPQLIEVEGASYIYLPSIEAIKKTLSLYFHVHAIRDQDVEVKKGWVEKDGETEYVYEANEIRAAQLGTESADLFFSTIKHVNFLPPLPKPHGDTYGMGRLVREEYSIVEDLATAS